MSKQIKVLDQFAAKRVEEVEIIFSILKDLYPKLKVDIQFDYENKYYDIKLLNVEEVQETLEIPLDLDVQVVYGDSVTGYTPIYIKTGESIEIHTIESIAEKFGDNKWNTCIEHGKEEKEFCEFEKCIETWTENGWTKLFRIIRHKLAAHKKIIRIITHTGVVDVTDDHSLLDKNSNIIKPDSIGIGFELLHHNLPVKSFGKIPLNTCEYFFSEVCKEYGIKSENGYILNINSQIKCAKLILIASNLGYTVYMNDIDNDKDNYQITITKNPFIENQNIIREMYEIPYEGYVYDLTTENHHFSAGIGKLIVHNTDSIMCKFSYNRSDKDANRLDTFRLAEMCGEKLTREIFNRHPIEMEFENVKNPFILIAKKHYIGKKFEDKKNPLKMKGYDIKGVALTKRNYCNLVKKCYKQVIDYIMENEEKSIDGIKDIIQKYLDDIRLYKVDIDDLVITASLAKTYKNENLPHVCLANKLRARKEEVQVGDRIPFIFIEDKEGMVTKKFERAEDPKYAKEHNLKIDRLSYLDQVSKPILGLLKIVLKRHPKEFNLILSRINETMVECNGKPLKEKDLIEIDEKVLE